MAVKLLSESMDATITDDDQIRIDAVLSFWFMEQQLGAPQIDGRLDTWFGEDPLFDQEIEKEFSDIFRRAARAKNMISKDSPVVACKNVMGCGSPQ